MLLIDTRLFVRSVRPAAVAAPFPHERFGHDAVRARYFLDQLPGRAWLMQALAEELTGRPGLPPCNWWYPDDFLDAAAGLIATGILPVARTVPDTAALVFDPVQPTAWDDYSAVVFSSGAVADTFLRHALVAKPAVAAFQQAYAALAADGTPDPASVPPWDGGNPARALAPLLATRRLVLVATRRHARPDRILDWRLQVQWLERHGPGVPVTVSPPPPRQAPVSPASPPPTQPALSAAPAVLPPQGQTLQAAARDGTPFCEECARAAAALAAASAAGQAGAPANG
ncbi:hypothetical protein [Rhodopila globiformis]|uniref:hypothetical protein n=1 Tax=Rhodopila globiformis TaxID=1071 RepID=UPI0013047F11|nr:hypothetical protein [Rhodopila globiformis]